MFPDTAFEMLLERYVMPHAYSRGSRLPFGETAERAASFCTDYDVVELLNRFGTSLHEIFQHANHRANRKDLQSRSDKTEAEAAAAGVAGDHVHSVSHSELLSYTDFLYLCDVAFYFQHQQQQNILSIHACGQIFIQVKEGGGSDLHSGLKFFFFVFILRFHNNLFGRSAYFFWILCTHIY
mgnify:CR=1 FL=1